ncbi:putative lipid II flippase FtsW [Paenibacillus thalictri]|uniref:Probable peptidoglycan glycosyltransferase FtsW n=1 Tax=Paenibacillus thalictri TaxID=2527873 RepID=A0A4Q9DUC7_9BACL|nr:putative lipid II flippase FtsW [Paenibacillus thalictri]TBL78307.1 putative lipid II flippase FtsW [Paenibacillus thalictri]
MSPPRRGTPDFLLLFLTFLLVCFGLAMVFSASSMTQSYIRDDPWYYTVRQAEFIAMGTVGMFVCMNMHYLSLKKWVIPFFLFVVALLFLVPIIGREVNGAKSWFYIGPFGIQPSEFAKLAVIMYLAVLISKKDEKFRSFRNGLLPALVVLAFVSGLIMLQPDAGSTMVLLMGASVIIFVGGSNLKHIFFLGTAAASAACLLLSFYLLTNHQSYRIDRFTTFLDPFADKLGKGYHLVQSLYAFGHGGVFGAGFGQSIQKLHYLPAAHNDFIFAIIGEELGFIGSSLFLIVYLLFIWRGLIVALRSTDMFATLAGVGIVSMLGIQALINIGGVTGSIPLTGVTLPLISYGGSSIITTLVSLGILLSISREQNKPDKETTKRA